MICMKLKFSSVRSKFLAVMIPLFIISFSAMIGISYYITSETLIENAHSLAAETGARFGEKFKGTLDARLARLEDLSEQQAIRSDSEADRLAALQGLKQRDKTLSIVAYLDLNGQAMLDSGQRADRSDREYFKIVKETKKPYINAPSIAGSTGKMILVLAYPVIDGGEMEAIVYGTIDLDSLTALSSDVKLFENGYCYIVDETGVTIGHSKRPEFVGAMNLTKKDIEGLGLQVDDRLMALFKEASTEKKEASGYYTNPYGGEQLAVIMPVQMDGRNFYVVAVAPKEEVLADANHILYTMLIILVVFIAIALTIVAVFTKKITDPIAIIRDDCVRLANGDLRRSNSATIESDDEIGQLAQNFRQMRRNLRELITEVKGDSSQVAAASEELTANSSQSAKTSEAVANSVVTIAAGLNSGAESAKEADKIASDMSASIDGIAKKASEIADVAKLTNSNANTGRAAVEDAVSNMQKIDDGTQNIQSAIVKLDEGSKEISNIVELISNIAAQTNLLALNAAIEAARAGEAGRGFAVVADEVRKLAEESEESSRKIGELILKNSSDMHMAVEASRAGSELVREGILVVRQAGETFSQIVSDVDNLTVQVEAINDAIREIAKGSEVMAQSVHKIEEASAEGARESESISAATEQQSASMQEIASASRSLAELAGKLLASAEKFRVQ
jgi:methyl-accepting chemotaxis protein